MDRIAIIGAGASGVMAALIAKNDHNIIDLYDKNDCIGKKIRVSGNGKCNISNANISKYDYFGNNLDFLEYGLKEFNYKRFEKFCNDLGLYLVEKDEGKVYPLSFESNSVIKIFYEKIKEKGINLRLSQEIVSVKKSDKKFILENSEKKISLYDKVLISSGSRAASKLGGSSFSEDVAKYFGHTLYQTYPSLVQLETKEKKVSKMAGVKIEAKVTLLSKEYKGISILGDVLFTKYGLSGFAVLDISFYVSKTLLKNEKVTISIDMLPQYDRVKLQSIVTKICKNNPKSDIKRVLIGILPDKIANYISLELGFIGKKSKELSIKDIKKIVQMIKDCRFGISDTHGFEYAEVCGGGIDTLEINPKTMESKLVNNLYFSGESLDIVGKRGGYNFAFAWMSGYLAGKNLRSDVK